MKQHKIQSPTLDQQIKTVGKIIQQVKKQKQKKEPKSKFIIGVCGIPGSGKSTVSSKLSECLPNSTVLPMDGFHIVRKLLNEQGIIRRGAAFTFDLRSFQQKVYKIKKSQIGTTLKYPSFSHSLKDPVQDAIQIGPSTQIVIVQGLYTFDRNLKINQCQSNDERIWDFKIWVEASLETAIERVAKRHLQSGIQSTYDLAFKRANSNDRANAIYVQENCFSTKLFRNLSSINESDGCRAIIIDNSKSQQQG